jgi:outer membrane murein-binding lipoprotein Lpp
MRAWVVLAILLSGCAAPQLRKENYLLKKKIERMSEVFRRQNAELETMQKREETMQETVRQAMGIIGENAARKKPSVAR